MPALEQTASGETRDVTPAEYNRQFRRDYTALDTSSQVEPVEASTEIASSQDTFFSQPTVYEP